MMNKKFQQSVLASFLAAALLLSACGGGGGAGEGTNAQATITGTISGEIASGSTEAAGTISVTDTDAGQATFAQPSNLTGAYGSWSFVVTGATAAWRYTLTTAPSVATIETLTVKSQDGSATQLITVSIAAGDSGSSSTSALVTTVSAPVYSGTYADEKVAVFNRLNDARGRCGFGKQAQNSKLDLAAQNHATYLALNKTLSHYESQGQPGYTGYEPGARITYAGYAYALSLENAAQVSWGTWYSGADYATTEAGSLTVLNRLFSTVYHLQGIMDRTTEVGFGVSNFKYNLDGSSNGKTLVINTGTPSGNNTGQLISTDAVATFPCNGISGLSPVFKGEDPDPFPTVNRHITPYGQPIYVTSGPGTTITLSSGTVKMRGGAAVPTTTLTLSNDPQSRLQANQVFLVPTARLADNSTYDVSMSGTSTGLVSTSNPTGAWTKTFSFTTGTVLSE